MTMSDKPYITCRQLIDFIVDYVDGALDETSRHDFERHLQVCASCRNYLDTYRATMSLTRIVVTDEPVEDAPEELVQAILSRRQ
jgi:anti-sigma factor RsiW